MIVKFNKPQLQTIIDDICKFTGMSMSVLDKNYETVVRCIQYNDFCSCLHNYSAQKSMCHSCDEKLLETCKKTNKLVYHICHAGLYDSAMPINKDGQTVGFILMGRIRSENSPKSIAHLQKDLKHDSKSIAQLYRKTSYYTLEQLDALYDLFPNILFSKAITIEESSLASDLKKFVANNLHKHLSIDILCAEFNISRNHIYRVFKENFDTTVNEYITRLRIEYAKKLLHENTLKMYQIAEKVGFDNYNYFCRIFKKRTGYMPTQYVRLTATGQIY